jgi:glycosyltransferase involved in cell wall biosynthesis
MRLLMIIHTPWSNDLGAPQAQLALAEEFVRAGDEVAKFSYEDAFPPAPQSRSRLGHFVHSNRSFARRARAFVRSAPGRFDIIEAHQTDLPYSKADLLFSGLLVARSVGLIPAYQRFDEFARKRWPRRRSLRTTIGDLLTVPSRRRRARDVRPSLEAADLINVPNRDELREVRDAMGFGRKVHQFPLGIGETRARALAAARAPSVARLAAQEVAFIGAWNPRKGAEDWPAIIHQVRLQRPATRFHFLGTTLAEGRVLESVAAEDRHAVRVVPSFGAASLPHLLANSTVGAFPAYLEGFGIAALELMAAALPVIAYDAPGVRETVSHQCMTPSVSMGDVNAFAERLVATLSSTQEVYEARAAESAAVAQRFLWSDIAHATRELYRIELERLTA